MYVKEKAIKVKILGGTGLHASERRAVARMEETFQDSWSAYASLLIADDQGSMDVDTLIITHDRLLLVELKEWNGRLESEEGKWFLNGHNKGKSPYEIKRVHAIRLSRLLQKELQHKLGYYPIVEAHVVLCGTASPAELSTSERLYVHTLDEFLAIAKPKDYDSITENKNAIIDRLFVRGSWPRPNDKVHCLPIFKSFFEGSRVRPKVFVHHDYVAEETCWFEHHNHIYQEYKAKNQEEPLLQGLIRRWDFMQLGTGQATQEQWGMIALRERRVLDYAKSQSSMLEGLMLRPIVPLTSEDVREDCTELYDLRKTYQRFDEYIALNALEWSREKRADLVRALLAPFSELHGLDLGHRDIDGHNLWYAPEDQSIVTSGYANAFFPEKGTIQDLRQLMQSSYLKLPEDVCLMEGDILDPFRQDVYMLAVVAYQICFDGRQPTSEDGIPVWSQPEEDVFDGKLDSWFSVALNWDAADRFTNASEMLARFNQLTRDDAPLHTDRQDVFNALMSGDFIKRNLGFFSLYSEYPPEPGENPGSGQKQVYTSRVGDHRYLCKIWPYLQISVESVGVNRKLLQFKKRLELLSGAHLHIPQIKDFGLFEGGVCMSCLNF